jgi:putative oxidoreductase
MNTLTTERVWSHRAVHAGLWSAQAVLVVVFAWAGMLKLAMPIDDLVQRMGLAAGTIRFIAVAELAAAVGLDPLLTKAKPALTGLAGVGLALVMMLAAAYHLGRGETSMIPTNLALGALATFVAWGRLNGDGR